MEITYIIVFITGFLVGILFQPYLGRREGKGIRGSEDQREEDQGIRESGRRENLLPDSSSLIPNSPKKWFIKNYPLDEEEKEIRRSEDQWEEDQRIRRSGRKVET